VRRWLETLGVPLSHRVEKMKLSKDKSALTVNPSLTLAALRDERRLSRRGCRNRQCR
jgi:hypothetical protein